MGYLNLKLIELKLKAEINQKLLGEVKISFLIPNNN